MSKYLISRLLIVFLVKFFVSWLSNIDRQITLFFDYDLAQGFFTKILSWVLGVSVFALGFIVINIVFTILHWTDSNNFKELFQATRNEGMITSIRAFFNNFFHIASENFGNEVKRERYAGIFIVYAIIAFYFIKGNPLLNNYYGVYKEYELEDAGREGETEYVEKQYFLYPKNLVGEIDEHMSKLEEDAKEDEPPYEVKKRGYLFLQAGLIDGYKTSELDYKGLGSYIESLFFSAFEKLINTIMYFFIPLIITIVIYEYRANRKEAN